MDIQPILKYIIDDNYKINYSYSKINNENLYVLHIFNPYRENISINKFNSEFYEKYANMMYDINGSYEGCFNLEIEINKRRKFTNKHEILTSYLGSYYIFILFNIKQNVITPLSSLAIDNKSTLWNICSNFKYRNYGYMSKLLKHVLILIKNNKLKDKNITLQYLNLYINNLNPTKDKLLNFYKIFNFKQVPNFENSFLLMKFII